MSRTLDASTVRARSGSSLLGTPRWVAWLSATAVLVLVLPLVALLLRTPWTRLPAILLSAPVRQALWLSLTTATAATVLGLLLGVPLAWSLAHASGRTADLLRVLVTLPVVFPPVVGGVALLMAFGRRGVIGRWLDEWFGIGIPFTSASVVLSQVFVAMPFLVLSVEGALRQLDPRLDEAAATLGASPTRRLLTVALPQVAPALAAGAALCWARALGEFGATVTFAGNFPGRTQTLPLAIYQALESDPGTAVAMAVLMIAVCLVVLLSLRRTWWPVGGAR